MLIRHPVINQTSFDRFTVHILIKSFVLIIYAQFCRNKFWASKLGYGDILTNHCIENSIKQIFRWPDYKGKRKHTKMLEIIVN